MGRPHPEDPEMRLPAWFVMSVAATTLMLAPAARAASAEGDAQARYLEEAAANEVKDHDREGEAIFKELAQKARTSGPLTIADLPAPMRDEVRIGRRDTQEADTHVILMRVESRLAALSPSVRASNADLVAHATVDSFIARRELSEPRPWHTCALDAVRHAEADLDKITDGDRDRDGIPDSRDRCPDDPEDKDGFQDEDGCPDPDNDNDGILDGNDRCPNDPEDKDGFEDQDGCPDTDNDKDGIPDVSDLCPNDPETKNGIADEDGCPDDFRRVYFDSDKSDLDANARNALKLNAEMMRELPSMRIRLEGHCDSQNTNDYNYRLGHRRAAAVKDYLVTELGISASRLETESHGEEMPVGDNSTAEGREANRRVEFVPIGAE